MVRTNVTPDQLFLFVCFLLKRAFEQSVRAVCSVCAKRFNKGQNVRRSERCFYTVALPLPWSTRPSPYVWCEHLVAIVHKLKKNSSLCHGAFDWSNISPERFQVPSLRSLLPLRNIFKIVALKIVTEKRFSEVLCFDIKRGGGFLPLPCEMRRLRACCHFTKADSILAERPLTRHAAPQRFYTFN